MFEFREFHIKLPLLVNASILTQDNCPCQQYWSAGGGSIAELRSARLRNSRNRPFRAIMEPHLTSCTHLIAYRQQNKKQAQTEPALCFLGLCCLLLEDFFFDSCNNPFNYGVKSLCDKHTDYSVDDTYDSATDNVCAVVNFNINS